MTSLQQRLLDTAYELTAEFDGQPPGSVMRCYFRLAMQARAGGVEPADLPEVARAQARVILRARDELPRSPRGVRVRTPHLVPHQGGARR